MQDNVQDVNNSIIQEANQLFQNVWNALKEKHGDEIQFPTHIVWLGGAPGSGKGTQTKFILKKLKISTAPVIMSDLLNSPEAKKIKDAGGLVGDREVAGILLNSGESGVLFVSLVMTIYI